MNHSQTCKHERSLFLDSCRIVERSGVHSPNVNKHFLEGETLNK